MTDRYRIPKTIARELLAPPHDQSDQFTPEQQRSRPGEDRASRDHSPGSQRMQQQQQQQQRSTGPTVQMQYDQGVPAQTWPGFHHPPQRPYNQQQQWQQQHQHQWQMMQQQQQWPPLQGGGVGNYYDIGNYGRDDRGQQRSFDNSSRGGPPQQQQQQQQQQAGAGGAALSTSERPVYPPASLRRPRDGPLEGSGKQQRISLDFTTRHSNGLTFQQLTCESKKPEPTPEGESLSGARMFEMNDANAAE